MADLHLSTPRVRVVRESDPEPRELQTVNADLVLWDRTRVKHRWPALDDAPFLWLTFVSWAAARRSRLIDPAITYEMWEADTLAIEAITDDDAAGDDAGRPTPPGPDQG